jgi:DNA-binding protein HU-beta
VRFAKPKRLPRSNNMAMTKDQLISDIAESTDTPKSTIRAVLEQLSEIVSDALENGDEITLPGIGKLKVSERPARTGRNPQTGKAIEIAAKKVVKYVPAKALSDAIN